MDGWRWYGLYTLGSIVLVSNGLESKRMEAVWGPGAEWGE